MENDFIFFTAGFAGCDRRVYGNYNCSGIADGKTSFEIDEYAAGIIRALGDSRTPLYFLIFSSGLNIILDLFLILVLKMGVAGAGIATVFLQFVSAILCTIYSLKKFQILRLKKRHFVWDKELTAASKVETLVTQPFNALAMAVNIFAGEWCTSLFLNDPTPEILRYGRTYLFIIAFFYPMLATLTIYRNSLQGMGDGLVPLIGGIGEFASRFLVAIILPRFIGFYGICAASPVAWCIAAAILVYRYVTWVCKGKRNNINTGKKRKETSIGLRGRCCGPRASLECYCDFLLPPV